MTLPQDDANRLREIAVELKTLIGDKGEEIATIANRLVEITEILAAEIERWEPFWKQAKK